jgi:hypothetical protein
LNKNSLNSQYSYKSISFHTTFFHRASFHNISSHQLIVLAITLTLCFCFVGNTANAQTNIDPIVQNGDTSDNAINNQKLKQWLFLHPYTAQYSVLSDDKKLGNASRQLTNNNGQWQLSSKAKIKKYFLKLQNHEQSQFHFDNNQLITDHFVSNTKISFKKAKKMEQFFDWNNNIEKGTRGKKSWEIKLEQQTFDRISHIIQLREDLIAGKKETIYLVSSKGKSVNYVYNLDKVETVSTPMGKLSALKLVRQKDNGDQFVIWLCPELNYFPIQIAQYDKGEPDITLLMTSLTFDQ